MIGNLIFFIFSFFSIGYLFPILGIFDLHSKTKKDIIFQIIKYARLLFSFKIFRISKEKLEHHKDLIYLCNHRSFSDMFIDQILTEYCGKTIARYMVLILFPFSYILSKIANNCYFINRGNVGKIDEFFKKVEINRKLDKYNNFIVYPEGTRRPRQNESCMLKKGFIYHSYNYNLPLQIIITKNKEDIIEEKKFMAKRNVNLYVYYSHIIFPDYKKFTREEYYEYIQNIWDCCWKKVYKTKYNKKSLKEIEQNYIYNNNNKLSQEFRLFKYLFIFILFMFFFNYNYIYI
jgi:1-acyl-sn-glycerol-3-phosphate acyltransferase